MKPVEVVQRGLESLQRDLALLVQEVDSIRQDMMSQSISVTSMVTTLKRIIEKDS